MKYLILASCIAFLSTCSKDDPFPQIEEVFGTRLKTVTYYIQTPQGDYRPGEKIDYYYTAGGGKLGAEVQSQYDVMTKSFELFSTAAYSYQGNKLDHIEKQINGANSTVVTRYEYHNDDVARIFMDDVVDTDATVKYLAGDTVEVLYNHSNGRFFTYRFKLANNNIVYEQTINESRQLSSETRTDYDSFKNPFMLLGYTDLLFSNFSANNKIKTTASYYADAFPASEPVAYEYEYNSLGYPTTKITTYKSSGSSGATGKSKTVFEYY